MVGFDRYDTPQLRIGFTRILFYFSIDMRLRHVSLSSVGWLSGT